MIKPASLDSIRIDHAGIHLGDKPIPGVVRWTARHEPDRGVFEVQLTLVTDSCHVHLETPGQLLGGPVGQQARAGAAAAIEKNRTSTLLEEEAKAAPAAPQEIAEKFASLAKDPAAPAVAAEPAGGAK